MAFSSICHTGPLLLFNGLLELALRLRWSAVRRAAIPRKPAEIPSPELWASLWKKLVVSHLFVGPVVSALLTACPKAARARDGDGNLQVMGAVANLYLIHI